MNNSTPSLGLTRRAFTVSSLSLLATAALPINALAQLTGERVQDGVYTIAVFGDSMAEGLWTALYRKLQRDPRFEVLRRSRPVVGLARPDYYDWETELANFLRADPIDAAIFSIGLNDMQGMVVPGGQPYQFRSEAWSAEYRARVTRLVRQLKAANVPTFWIGLPIMRSQQYSGNIAHLNGIFQEVAAAEGITFVPLWDLTTDASGAFSTYLPDANGRNRQMRDNDGIHFTMGGYEMLADEILSAMRRELPILQTSQVE